MHPVGLKTVAMGYNKAQSGWLSAGLLLSLAAAGLYWHGIFDLFLTGLYLATAYAGGSFLRFRAFRRPILTLMLRLLGGVAILTVGTWAVTLFSLPHKQLFMAATVGLLFWRRRQLRQVGRNLRRIWMVQVQAAPLVAAALVAVAGLFLIYASYPITSYDALAAHLVIPAKILAGGRYDYNVIESLVFTTPDLMLHMAGVWLMALGATKGLVYFVAAMGLAAMVLLVLMLRKSNPAPRFSALLTILLFGLTPLTVQQSVFFTLDIMPLPFLFLVIGFLVAVPTRGVVENLPVLMGLLGAAMFGKRAALYMVLFLGPTMLVMAAWSIRLKEVTLVRVVQLASIGAGVMLLVFAGPFFVVWNKTGSPIFPYMNEVFKSIYFPQVNFKDPYSSPLGLDFTSLIAIVFHTGKHLEMPPGGLGYHLLMFPFAMLYALICRDRKWLLISLCCLGGYYFSTRTTYNIRYFLAAFALTMPVTSFALAGVINRIPLRKLRGVVMAVAVLGLTVPCFHFLFLSAGWSQIHFKWAMLYPDDRMCITPFDDVFEHIPGDRAAVFYNGRHPLRGDYPGFFCSASWHNMFILDLLNKAVISVPELLEEFEYVIDPIAPDQRGLDLQEVEQKDLLALIYQGELYKLYRVKREAFKKGLTMEEVFSVSFDSPLVVSVSNSKTYRIDDAGQHTRFIMDVEANGEGRMGRCQINWFTGKDGSYVGSTLHPFPLRPGRHVYQYDYETPHADDVYGVLYLTSHDEQAISIHSLTLLKERANRFRQALAEYDARWPHLARPH